MAFNWKFWEKAPAQPDKPDSAAPTAPAGVNPEDLKGLPKKLARFLMSPQGAEAAKKIKETMERMKADGVDVKNETAVKKWLEEHKTEFQAEAPAAVPQFVRPEPKVGRNDPCPCGSGKKFKKCHEAKAAA